MVSKNSFTNFLPIAIIFISIALLTQCSPPNKKKQENSEPDLYQEVKIKRVKFNFDQQFEIREVKKGSSISDLRVSGIGFPNSSNTLIFEAENPLENFLIADLDDDGFEELYLITRSVGSGSFGKIIGITSNKGKSYKTIYVPEYDKTFQQKLEYLQGYMGHDSIYIKENKLFREFPVFKSTDTNSKPTGGRCKLVYTLIEINQSFSLQVKTFQIIK